jgi:hypothetical protein
MESEREGVDQENLCTLMPRALAALAIRLPAVMSLGNDVSQ